MKIKCLLLIIALTSAAKNSFTKEIIPFRLSGKLILLLAEVDGKHGYFILDTGVSTLVLNSKYFSGKPSGNIYYGIYGEESPESKNVSVNLGQMKWKNISALITYLGHFENRRQIAILGLLGCDLFRNCELTIDYREKVIMIQHLGRRRNHQVQRLATPSDSLSFQCKGRSPFILAKMGMTDLKLILDTGAEYNLLRLKHMKLCQQKLTDQREIAATGISKEMKKLSSGTLHDLSVGRSTCAPMKTIFTSLKPINKYCPGPKIDGALGFEFLNQFRTAINFRKKKIYFWQEKKAFRR